MLQQLLNCSPRAKFEGVFCRSKWTQEGYMFTHAYCTYKEAWSCRGSILHTKITYACNCMCVRTQHQQRRCLRTSGECLEMSLRADAEILLREISGSCRHRTNSCTAPASTTAWASSGRRGWEGRRQGNLKMHYRC